MRPTAEQHPVSSAWLNFFCRTATCMPQAGCLSQLEQKAVAAQSQWTHTLCSAALP